MKESLHEESKPAPKRYLDPRTLLASLRNPLHSRVLIGIFLTTFAFAQFEMTLALVTKELGMAERGNFLVFAYLGFTLMLCQVPGATFPSQAGERRMALSGATLLIVGLALAGWIGHYYIQATPAVTRSTADTVQQAGQEMIANPGVRMLLLVLPLSIMGFSAINPSLQGILSLTTQDSDQGEVLGLARDCQPSPGSPDQRSGSCSASRSISTIRISRQLRFMGIALIAMLGIPAVSRQSPS